MPEFLRSLAARLRRLIGNRRRAPRYRVRLPFTVTLPDAPPLVPGSRRPVSVDGHTRDISASGLALIVPTIRIGDRYLTGHDRLHVALELPTGPVQIIALPVRYEPLEEDDEDTGFLIGVRIGEMGEVDRARYLKCLDRLRREKGWRA